MKRQKTRRKHTGQTTNPPPAQSLRSNRPAQRAVGTRIWKILTVVFGVSTSALSWVVVFPQTSVSVGPSRDATQPLETHFLLLNQWLLPIKSVRYDCVETDMRDAGRSYPSNVRIGFDAASSIGAGQTLSMYCGGNWYGYVDTYPFQSIERGLTVENLNIRVYFHVPLLPWEFHRFFGFSMVRNADGTASWLPIGGPLKDDPIPPNAPG